MSQQQHSITSRSDSELAIKPSINTLAQGAMFWQPDYRGSSSWLEHLPFLFWLIEALRPQNTVELGSDRVAHFALCQAVVKLRLNARCYTVLPDGQLEKVYDKEYATEHFASISQPLSTTATRAVEQFAEGSVDLLLLHVEASDDSVDYLLERWLSRLSSQGVVVVPGIACRDPGCLVFRAFEAIKSRYPYFEFHHAGGLGIIAVGEQLPTLLQNLLGALESDASTQVVQDVFARLGRGCQDKVTSRQQRVQVQRLEAKVSEQSGELNKRKQKISQQAEQLLQLNKEHEKLQASMAQQEFQAAHERGRLAERISSLEELNAELKQELRHQRQQAEQREIRQREEVLALRQNENEVREAFKLKGQYEQKQDELKVLRSTIQAREEQVLKLTSDLTYVEQVNTKEFARLNQLLDGYVQTLGERDKRVQELTQQLEKQKGANEECVNEISQLTLKQQDTERVLDNAEQSWAAAEQQVAQYEQKLSAMTSQLQASTVRENEALKAVDERFQEIAVLTELLEYNETQRNQLEKELEAAKAAQQRLVETDKSKVSQLTHMHQEMKRALGEAEKGRINAEQRAIQYKKECQTLSVHEKEVREALEERFHEIAVLTELLEQNETQRDHYVQTSSADKALPLSKRALKHQISMIRASSWFDAEWYLVQYPDVAADARMSVNPARHYLLMGGFEGRNPSPSFDSAYYLAQHSDVRESGMNPLVHFLKFGEKELRRVKANNK
ncbi:hypothetical protein [Vreelandella malpeensis]|uniref:Chromosome partition protein Smc n=1 Tax=Vreelandella malpeensis TaxID=1172368 RepID=A0ABS8DTF7_9GAMM|nr:hypothetical protein [Halomonas malpeensis]MCB8889549.1 hypothetical protein [Halomonas malpeensis]